MDGGTGSVADDYWGALAGVPASKDDKERWRAGEGHRLAAKMVTGVAAVCMLMCALLSGSDMEGAGPRVAAGIEVGLGVMVLIFYGIGMGVVTSLAQEWARRRRYDDGRQMG